MTTETFERRFRRIELEVIKYNNDYNNKVMEDYHKRLEAKRLEQNLKAEPIVESVKAPTIEETDPVYIQAKLSLLEGLQRALDNGGSAGDYYFECRAWAVALLVTEARPYILGVTLDVLSNMEESGQALLWEGLNSGSTSLLEAFRIVSQAGYKAAEPEEKGWLDQD